MFWTDIVFIHEVEWIGRYVGNFVDIETVVPNHGKIVSGPACHQDLAVRLDRQPIAILVSRAEVEDSDAVGVERDVQTEIGVESHQDEIDIVRRPRGTDVSAGGDDLAIGL